MSRVYTVYMGFMAMALALGTGQSLLAQSYQPMIGGAAVPAAYYPAATPPNYSAYPASNPSTPNRGYAGTSAYTPAVGYAAGQQRGLAMPNGRQPARYYTANNAPYVGSGETLGSSGIGGGQGGYTIGSGGGPGYPPAPSTGAIAAGGQGMYHADGQGAGCATGNCGNSAGGGCSTCGNGGSAGGGCSSCGGGGGNPAAGDGDWGNGSYFSSTCGMPEHMAYYPAMHGYYYFHPYHHTHVVYQQEFAARFGIDTRNPYSNDFFKAIYAEYRATQREQTGPEAVPAPRPGVAYPSMPTR